MAKNYSYQQPANTSSMSSSYSVYNQPQQSNNNQPQQNTSQPQRNNSQQSSYAAPQQQQRAAPLNMSAYSPPPQQSNNNQPQAATQPGSNYSAYGQGLYGGGTSLQQLQEMLRQEKQLSSDVRFRLAGQHAAMNPGQPPQPKLPTNGRDAWKQAGMPGWDPNAANYTVPGTAKDGNYFGDKAAANAYDRWRDGIISGNAQPNPTQQAARIPSPGQAQGIEPRSNGTPYMPPGAVRETSDFLAPEVRARSAAQQARLAAQQTAGGGDRTGGFFPAPDAVMGGPYPVPQSPAGGQDAWNQAGRPGWDPNGTYAAVTGKAKDGTPFSLSSEAWAYDRWRAGSQGNAQPNPTQPQRGFEPWLNPQPQQSPASGRDAWKQAGRPGYDPNAMRLTVTGTAKDGTEFGYKAEADAYDRWREGSQGNAQPNPTQPPPYGRYGGPQQDRLMPAQPVAPPYNPAYGNMEKWPIVLHDPAQEQRFKDGQWGGNVMGFLDRESRRQREERKAGRNPFGPLVDDKGRTVEIPMPQPAAPADPRYATMAEVRTFSAPPRPAPQPGQNSYGFRGYDIDNGYSIRPPDSPANAANFGFGPKPNLFSQSFTSPDGTTSDQPNFNQRDAFLNNLLDHDSENPGGMYQGGGRAPQSFMNPRPDIMGMWNKAGSMARDGWTNPVAGLMNQSR